MDAFAIRTTPAFHPYAGYKTEKVTEHETMSPQAHTSAFRATKWFFPGKMFAEVLNNCQIYPKNKYRFWSPFGDLFGADAGAMDLLFFYFG
jgi:hypothetical protein